MPGRVLVTGATGFVGRALVRALQDRGHAVVRAVRTPEPRGAGAAQTIVIPDCGPHTDWSSAVAGVDTVVHLAARVHVLRERAPDPLGAFRRVNVEGTRRLLDASQKAGVQTFLFLSSIAAVASHSDRDLDESAPCCPSTPYGHSKLEAEQIIRRDAGRLRWVVLRPPMLYGPRAPGNFATLARAVRAGWPFPFGAVANRRSFMFVENLADAIVHALEDPRAQGMYHVSDARPISTPELIRGLARALGVRTRLIAVPPRLLMIGARAVGWSEPMKKLLRSLPVDSRRFSQALGWEPRWDLKTALEQSVRDDW